MWVFYFDLKTVFVNYLLYKSAPIHPSHLTPFKKNSIPTLKFCEIIRKPMKKNIIICNVIFL